MVTYYWCHYIWQTSIMNVIQRISKVLLQNNKSTTNFWYNLNKKHMHILWDVLWFAYFMGCNVICIFYGMYCDSFINATDLVHDDDEWQFGLVEDAAGIEHVGHEGHRVHTTSCVHHIHYYGRIRGGLQWDGDWWLMMMIIIIMMMIIMMSDDDHLIISEVLWHLHGAPYKFNIKGTSHRGQWVNSSPPGQNGHHFGRRHIQTHFHEWKVLYIDSNSISLFL